MKILKLLVFNCIYLICTQSIGQNLKNQIKLNASQQLFKKLESEENHLIYLINGFYNENNALYITRINYNEIEKTDCFDEKIALKYTKQNAKNGGCNLILKNKKIKNLDALNKHYPFDKRFKNEYTISGVIVNSFNRPIPNAIISNIEKRESYKSDSQGKYSLNVNLNDVLYIYKEGIGSKRVGVDSHMKKKIILDDGSEMVKKPVIYLYPTEKTDIKLTLDFKGNLLTTFPKYSDNWDVTAYPNGQIFDKKSQRFYNSLFWDGTLNFPKEHYNYQTGFVISKKKLTSFLIEKLELIGLNYSETNDFIQYWLPILEKNELNFIHFYVNSEYEIISKNRIDPKPETSIRVFMEFYGLEKPITISEQKLLKTERKGFTLVEWGGSEVSLSINQFKN